MAAGSNIGRITASRPVPATPADADTQQIWNGKVVLIGSSTGGWMPF